MNKSTVHEPERLTDSL